MSISKKSVSSPAVSSQPEPHQASQQQVEHVIASALPLTGMIPVVEAPTSPDAQEPQQPRESGFAEAIRVAGVIILGLFFVGIGLGVLVHSYGLPFWVAPLLPLLVFAGSVEFVLIDMISNHASLLSIAVMTLLINSRHLMYGLSYPIERVRGGLAKFYTVYTLIDEAYALNTGPDRHKLRASRILLIHAGLHLSVLASATLGYVLGASFLSELKGVDFVMTALFAVLAIDAYQSSKDHTTAAIAGVSAAVGLLVAPQSMLLISMVVYILLLVSRFVVAKRRGTLPEHMLVADEDPAETAEAADTPAHPGDSAH
ncbi:MULTISPECIES: AzlC family ABC transporter permease [Rothia]|jgi:predicted branched-chain amino acid permease|uniref:AzlC family ABC transporter permease n=1 Tax=Rothia TaxID=32207 RepID=UPI0008A2C8DF|nr:MULTISPECIES: AzlC family ABC transporter permease [Rothia]OFL21554.1 branched-chain amino acid permease [Rothia sp. HMSC069C03]OFQ61834.1 branched-chain amino acid permease [Rothia sp. HMSC061E04]